MLIDNREPSGLAGSAKPSTAWMTAAPGDPGGFPWAEQAPGKGGASMQKPIRYYITKSGEEPTVRSVRVALGESEPRVEADTTVTAPEASVGKRPAPTPATEVTRRVKDAIRRTVDR